MLCSVSSSCSEGRDRQPNMLAETLDLSCDALANAAQSTRWTLHAPGGSIAKSQFLRLSESEEVLQHFDEIGYRFDDVRASLRAVPRVYLASVPDDIDALAETTTRKRLFLAAVLPAILAVNESLRETRRRLTSIAACQEAGHVPSEPVRNWIAELAAYYRTKADAEALLLKVGEIPPSLALAQAAMESGWGTSSPAQTINALFGQYAYGEKGDGRSKKTVWRLAVYDSLFAAVRSYADNLNSHRAYREFRERRAEMLSTGQPLDGLELARYLTSYSQRRSRYVRDVQAMIRANDLADFDRVDLVSRHGVMVSEN